MAHRDYIVPESGLQARAIVMVGAGARVGKLTRDVEEGLWQCSLSAAPGRGAKLRTHKMLVLVPVPYRYLRSC